MIFVRNGFSSTGIDAVYDDNGQLRYEPFIAIVPENSEPYDAWEETWSDVRLLWRYEGKYAGSPGIKKHVDYFFDGATSGKFKVYRRIRVYNSERTYIDFPPIDFILNKRVGPTPERHK